MTLLQGLTQSRRKRPQLHHFAARTRRNFYTLNQLPFRSPDEVSLREKLREIGPECSARADAPTDVRTLARLLPARSREVLSRNGAHSSLAVRPERAGSHGPTWARLQSHQ